MPTFHSLTARVPASHRGWRVLSAGLLCLALGWAGAAEGDFPASVPPVSEAVAARIAQALPQAQAQPGAPRHLLVLTKTQGFRHTSISDGCEALRQIGARTRAFSVTFSDDLADLEAPRLAQFDGLLLLSTSGLTPSPSQQAALLAFVTEQGRGLIGIHGATDNFPEWKAGQALIGGVFKGHPWRASDTSAIKLDDPQHPLTAAFGGKGFWIKDELYQIGEPYDRAAQRTLMSLDMSRPQNARPAKEIIRTDNDFPVAWVKVQGKGRVFYSSLGHNAEVFATPAVLQHYLDGIQYALGDLAADAAPSAILKPQPAPALAPVEVTPLTPVARAEPPAKSTK